MNWLRKLDLKHKLRFILLLRFNEINFGEFKMSKAVIFDKVREALNFDYYDMYLAKGLVDATTQI